MLYHNASSGTAYVGVGGPGLDATASRHPPGDGSSNRDNGVRIDLALKVVIPLSDTDKLELINQFLPLQSIYDDETEAYFYEHGNGF